MIDNFWLFTTTLILAILSPGPSFVGVTRYFLHYGFKKTLAFNAGIALGEGVLSALVLLGLSTFILENLYFNYGFHFISGFYLIYIGYQMIQAKSIEIDSEQVDNTKKTHAFLSGFLIGSTNPKSLIFDAALLSIFISIDTTIFQKTTLWIWMVLGLDPTFANFH